MSKISSTSLCFKCQSFGHVAANHNNKAQVIKEQNDIGKKKDYGD